MKSSQTGFLCVCIVVTSSAVACDQSDSTRMPDGYACELSADADGQPEDPSLYSFTAQDVWDAVEGHWVGTFPGNELVSAADLDVTVSRREGDIGYSVPIALGDYEVTEADRASCGGIAAPVHITIVSSASLLALDLETWVGVEGHEMSGVLLDSSSLPPGVAVFHSDIEEGPPDYRELSRYFAFESSGAFYVSVTVNGLSFLYAGTRE